MGWLTTRFHGFLVERSAFTANALARSINPYVLSHDAIVGLVKVEVLFQQLFVGFWRPLRHCGVLVSLT